MAYSFNFWKWTAIIFIWFYSLTYPPQRKTAFILCPSTTYQTTISTTHPQWPKTAACRLHPSTKHLPQDISPPRDTTLPQDPPHLHDTQPYQKTLDSASNQDARRLLNNLHETLLNTLLRNTLMQDTHCGDEKDIYLLQENFTCFLHCCPKYFRVKSPEEMCI